MAETPFTIGADVRCADGICGKVTHIVVDPVKRAVTDLLVEPRHWPGLGRLVPLDLVDAATTKEVRLRCTRAEFDQLGFAEDTDFAPRTSPEQYPGYRPTRPPPMALTCGLAVNVAVRGTSGAHGRGSECVVEGIACPAAGLGYEVAVQVHRRRDGPVPQPAGDLGDGHALG